MALAGQQHDVAGPRPLEGGLDRRPAVRDREDVHVTAEQLLDVASTPGDVTENGLRSNISVGIQYLESWLRGSGAVGINNLMEDAATAEISRSQVWQWIHQDRSTEDGTPITSAEIAYGIARTLRVASLRAEAIAAARSRCAILMP